MIKLISVLLFMFALKQIYINYDSPVWVCITFAIVLGYVLIKDIVNSNKLEEDSK